jgi:DTW domain-containing protein YfiP
MREATPGTTFHGLPLTSEQHSEIQHYIHRRQRAGKQWDTPELQAMLADMLDPPEAAVPSRLDDDASTAAERLMADHDHGDEPMPH